MPRTKGKAKKKTGSSQRLANLRASAARFKQQKYGTPSGVGQKAPAPPPQGRKLTPRATPRASTLPTRRSRRAPLVGKEYIGIKGIK